MKELLTKNFNLDLFKLDEIQLKAKSEEIDSAAAKLIPESILLGPVNNLRQRLKTRQD